MIQKACCVLHRLTGKKLTPFYHDDKKDGITRGESTTISPRLHTRACLMDVSCFAAAQMALYAKYEDYAIQGAAVFHDRCT